MRMSLNSRLIQGCLRGAAHLLPRNTYVAVDVVTPRGAKVYFAGAVVHVIRRPFRLAPRVLTGVVAVFPRQAFPAGVASATGIGVTVIGVVFVVAQRNPHIT